MSTAETEGRRSRRGLPIVGDVAVDGAGNLYIAETYRIRKVDSTGTITTVAGTGEDGYSGDGGPAVEAALQEVQHLAVDGAGNIYILPLFYDRIRRVDSTTGIITTVAGTGKDAYSGDGGLAVEAASLEVQHLAVDGAGNLYFMGYPAIEYPLTLDQFSRNPRIRRVDSTGTITTVVGGLEFGYIGDGGPVVEAAGVTGFDLAVDDAGNLYIAAGAGSIPGYRVLRVDSTGIITTVAGTGVYAPYGISDRGDGGPAVEATLEWVTDVAVDGAGNLYLAESGWDGIRIRRVDSAGTITTVAGSGVSDYGGNPGQ